MTVDIIKEKHEFNSTDISGATFKITDGEYLIIKGLQTVANSINELARSRR